MRVSFIIFALLIVGGSAQKAKFVTKFKKIVSDYLGGNTDKTMDLVNGYLVQQLPFENITTNIMNQALSLVPAAKYLSALSMFTTFDSCVKKTGNTLDTGMAAIAPAFMKHLTKPYNQIINKMKTMTKNKKPEANKKKQAYILATSAMTKALIQQIINSCKTATTEPLYNCALGPLNTIMRTNLYNMVYSKTG